MFKVFITAGVLLLTAITANPANATDFKEGLHYDTYASSKLTGKPTFIEYLSFFCPACENLNTFQDEIYRSVPKGVIKRRVSVDIISKTSPDGFLALSKVMAVSDELYPEMQKRDAERDEEGRQVDAGEVWVRVTKSLYYEPEGAFGPEEDLRPYTREEINAMVKAAWDRDAPLPEE